MVAMVTSELKSVSSLKIFQKLNPVVLVILSFSSFGISMWLCTSNCDAYIPVCTFCACEPHSHEQNTCILHVVV